MEDGLCKLCAGLDVYGAAERLIPLEGSPTGNSIRLESPWHGALADVDASSSSCTLCTIVMKGWQASREVVVEQAIRDAMFDPEAPPSGLNDPVARIPAYWDASGITLEVVRRREVEDGPRGNDCSLSLLVECGPTVRASFDVLDRVVAELRITLAPETADAAAREIWAHTDPPVHAEPLSEGAIGVARRWLETCVNRHGSACGPPAGEEGWVPTRLLELVPDSDKVYLRVRETPGSAEDARYVALSHCWGQGGTPFTTTHQTLDLRMAGIKISDLPATFRDSITLTERLGLRYMWIDSLCIIQDDAQDWAFEAAQMAKVYRNAHVVLNAANSDADSKGFLGPRDIQNRARLPPNSPEKHPLYLQLLPARGRRWLDAGMDSLAGEPISSRAWCLQERALPARSLQYGSHQVFWECELMRASEDGVVVGQEGGQLKRLCKTGNTSRSVFARPSRDPSGELKHKVNWVDWYCIVENYTARNITKHTDRLPALSGLAQAVVREAGDGYLAGLWRSGLLEGLLWCKTEPGQALASTPEYVAPSWSWASVVGQVQFPIYTWYTRRARWKARMADFEPLAQYIGHSMVNKDVDPYGRLEGGRLSLKAPLLPVLSIQPRPAKAPALHSLLGQAPGRAEVADAVIHMKTDSGSIWVEGGFDKQDTAVDSTKLFVAMITRLPHVLEEGFVEHRFGLLLERLDDDKRYRRVGFVDGVVLQKSLLDAVRGRGMFSTVGYARPFEKGDIDRDIRDNDLASDPLASDMVEVEIW